jgi:hypothetical protein
MITAADATSRAVVVVLFGPDIAVWAAVEGMTLLSLKGSGFGEGHVLPVGTFLRIPTVVLVVIKLCCCF